MRDKIALALLGFSTLVCAATAPVKTKPSINVLAEIELMNGRVIRPSLAVKEGEWGTIDLGGIGVGVKIRARRQGQLVKTDYQLFLVNGVAYKTWKTEHIIASWSQRMTAHVPVDKASRVRHMLLTSSLLEDGKK